MGIFNKIKKTKKTKEKIQNNNNLNYKLAGLYLNDGVDLTPIENKIAENTNTLKDHNLRINNNINNIATNVNNINNLNTKINKITNDLNNANIANYKGLYNNTINYKLGDLVSDNNTNNVYLSVSNNNINNPLNNNNFWKIITFTIDTSDFITSEKLDNRLSNYWTTDQTIAQINLKQHKPSYVKNIVINGNARVMKILSDTLNQWSLFWYPTNIIIDIPTFSNLEPNKDYFLKIYSLSFSSDGGVSKFTNYIYGKVYTSNSNGELIIPRTEYFIQFGLRNKYIRDYNKDTEVNISAIAEILRIGK